LSSLQDQLLKAGLVDDKKVKRAQKEQRKAAKVQRHSAGDAVDETRLKAEQALVKKAQRDRELNAERNAAAEKKAFAAQVRQLIEMNRQPRAERGTVDDIAYNFTDGSKIKKIYVSAPIQQQLSLGRLAIAKLNDKYELVPAGIAEKISSRDASYIVAHATRSQADVEGAEAEDDPYAEYKIPDDLMW
jgi:uncharacterized protein YaiL (DUF2058 family)